MLVLSKALVETLIDTGTLIDALADAMADLSGGRASIPKRAVAMVGERGLLAAMPAHLQSDDAVAAKLVLVFPGNAERGLATHQALIAVFDPDTGVPVALMDGAAITAARTAAGSALATRLCARADAKVLAIIGTGVQARAHARAIPHVRPITDILIAGRSPERARELAGAIGAKAMETFEDAVREADIVCACTHSHDPVVRSEWLKPASHVNAVGFTAGMELEPDVFADAFVLVESRDAAIGGYPDGAPDITAAVERGIISIEDIAEVGELVGRGLGRSPEVRSVYRSVGVAAQDAAAAALVLENARARGLGVHVDL